MGHMRNLDEKYKIPGRSIPEIVDRFEGLLSRQKNIVGRKFYDPKRKLPAEVLTNAIILHFLGMTASEQDAALDRYLPELDALMQDDAGEVPAKSVVVKHTADVSPQAKSRRRSG
jgi:hypothetical protein